MSDGDWQETLKDARYFAKVNGGRRRVYKDEDGVWTWDDADPLSR